MLLLAYKSSHFQLGCIELRPFIWINTKRLILCFGSWVIWGQFWSDLTGTKVDKYQILVFKVSWWWIQDEQKDKPPIRKYTWLKKIKFEHFENFRKIQIIENGIEMALKWHRKWHWMTAIFSSEVRTQIFYKTAFSTIGTIPR